MFRTLPANWEQIVLLQYAILHTSLSYILPNTLHGGGVR